jgi:thiosulfate/3-mercaptopyruvate sulfurtransferase
MKLDSPLVAPEVLAAHLDDPDLRIVDVRWVLGQPGRGRAAYDAGHLPGAIHLDLDTDLVAPTGPGRHPLPDPAAFARLLEGHGIGDVSTVITYDDVGGWVAARLWWMLDNLGHRSVAVLDGGYPAWVGLGLPVAAAAAISSPAAAGPGPRRLHLAPAWSNVIDRDTLRSRLGSLVLLDVRGAPRYRGEIEPIDPVAGHIPTAVNAQIDGNLGPDRRFLPAPTLRNRYEALGCGSETEVVASCGSGVSACQVALSMRLAGMPDPILYPGSYSDWSRSGYPVAVGPEPGAPPKS